MPSEEMDEPELKHMITSEFCDITSIVEKHIRKHIHTCCRLIVSSPEKFKCLKDLGTLEKLGN